MISAELVKENIKKKFQDEKLPMVDEVLEFDRLNREAIQRADYLRSQRNSISKKIGMLMGKGQKEEAEAAKQQVKDMQDELAAIEQKEEEYAEEIRKWRAPPHEMRQECPEIFPGQAAKGCLISSFEAETGLLWMCAGPDRKSVV